MVGRLLSFWGQVYLFSGACTCKSSFQGSEKFFAFFATCYSCCKIKLRPSPDLGSTSHCSHTCPSHLEVLLGGERLFGRARPACRCNQGAALVILNGDGIVLEGCKHRHRQIANNSLPETHIAQAPANAFPFWRQKAYFQGYARC